MDHGVWGWFGVAPPKRVIPSRADGEGPPNWTGRFPLTSSH